jgi:hypothetical protein
VATGQVLLAQLANHMCTLVTALATAPVTVGWVFGKNDHHMLLSHIQMFIHFPDGMSRCRISGMQLWLAAPSAKDAICLQTVCGNLQSTTTA